MSDENVFIGAEDMQLKRGVLDVHRYSIRTERTGADDYDVGNINISLTRNSDGGLILYDDLHRVTAPLKFRIEELTRKIKELEKNIYLPFLVFDSYLMDGGKRENFEEWYRRDE